MIMSSSPRRGSAGRPRIEDVAKRAGTSAITVSRVLRQPEKVSDDTRRRVLLAVEQLGYIPDLAASGLASRRTGIVAVLVPTIANPVFAETVQGVAEMVRSEGLQILLGDYGYSDARERDLLVALAGRRPDAVICIGLVQEEAPRSVLRSLGVPVVESWDLSDDPLDMVVGFSNAQAGAAMARHMIAGGCRRLAFVGCADARASARAAGFASAAARSGLSVAFNLLTETSSLSGGARGLGRLIEEAPATDAVFFADDLLAAGALLECQRRGLDVPQRLALGGLGNMEIADALPPGITTIDVAAREIGRQAASAVLSRLRGDPQGQPKRDLGFSVVTRGSTRPAAVI